MSEPERLTRHWQNDDKRRPRRRGFEIQEELAARTIQGYPTRGSGSSPRLSQKGDAFSHHLRVSCKTTEKPGAKSIRVERVWLHEIEAQARATGHKPALMIGFSPDVEHPHRDDWLAFPLSVAEPMVKAIHALTHGRIGEARDLAELALGKK